MRTKVGSLLFLSIVSASCASTKMPEDWSLQSESNSAILRVIGDDGQIARPFNGHYFSMQGYIFVAGTIVLHPGKHKISYGCPQDPNEPIVFDYVPSLVYTFKAGQKYELSCVEHSPTIRLVE